MAKLAKQVLLLCEKVNVWLNKLCQPIVKGSAKGCPNSESHGHVPLLNKKNMITDIVYCGRCAEMYEEETKEIKIGLWVRLACRAGLYIYGACC